MSRKKQVSQKITALYCRISLEDVKQLNQGRGHGIIMVSCPCS